MIHRLAVLPLLVMLTACAAHAPWVNTHVPKSQWDADWESCQERAEARLPHRGAVVDDSAQDPFAEYDRINAKSEVDNAVAACMIGKGYLPARKKP